MDPRAIQAGILDDLFGAFEPETVVEDGVATVTIDGPLAAKAGWFDSHESISRRIVAALQDDTIDAVVLRIDSPGGHVAGLFEGLAKVRQVADQSQKPIYAYADELAASAAYAWATAADHIALPRSGQVGSVGVIATLVEQSRMLDRMGVTVRPITSGNQKADGHPALPLSDEATRRTQERVDRLAVQFAEAVANRRPITSAEVLGLEAGIFDGKKAVEAGLADDVSSFGAVMALAHQSAESARTKRKKRMELSTFAVACGLSAEASEAEVMACVQGAIKTQGKHEDLVASLTELTGETDPGKILGVLEAKLETASHVEDVEAQFAKRKAKDEQTEVKHALDAAELSGKRFNRAKAEGLFAKHGIEAFNSYLDAAGLRVAEGDEDKGEPKEPTPKASDVRLEDLSIDQRAAYRSKNGEAAYKELKADWERRGRPSPRSMQETDR